MGKAETTREKLVEAARTAFWTRGYSNVALRDIAAEAGVDVALISRYFGGKQGLFEATLERAFDWEEMLRTPGADPLEVAVAKFANPKAANHGHDAVTLLMANAGDPEVGEILRSRFCDHLLTPMEKMMGGEAARQKLALFMAVLIGMTMARQTLRIDGVTDVPPETHAAQLRHLAGAALSFGDD